MKVRGYFLCHGNFIKLKLRPRTGGNKSTIIVQANRSSYACNKTINQNGASNNGVMKENTHFDSSKLEKALSKWMHYERIWCGVNRFSFSTFKERQETFFFV